MEGAFGSRVQERIAVVTGGNKGIGLEICKQLASKGVTIILTARDERRGLEAVQSLKASGLADIIFHKLDVVQQSSATSLAAFIKQRFGRLDILVNNAGVLGVKIEIEDQNSLKQAIKDFEVNPKLLGQMLKQTYETAEQCLWTNYYGNKKVTQTLLPLLQQSNSARIVNISSSYGQLKLGDANGITEDKVDEVVKEFLDDAKKGQIENKGWPKQFSAYNVSKAAVNAYTRILANKYPNISINAVNPGYVKTDMTFHSGTSTAEEGARGAVMLALMPNGGPSGQYLDKIEQSTF